MCLAIPMKIDQILSQNEALVEYKGIKKVVDISLVHPVNNGEYVLVHTGFAIEKISEEEFIKTMEILEQEAKIREELFPEEYNLDTTQPQFIQFKKKI